MVLRAMRVGVVRLRRLRSGSTPRDNGWDRVSRDAAAAGHVDMVMFCLDEGYEGWEYTDSIMQAAESERRWNAVVALEKRGHSSTVRVREEAPVAPEGRGSSIYETLQEPCCRFEWNGAGRDESVGGEDSS